MVAHVTDSHACQQVNNLYNLKEADLLLKCIRRIYVCWLSLLTVEDMVPNYLKTIYRVDPHIVYIRNAI